LSSPELPESSGRSQRFEKIVAVALNPAIDRVVEVEDFHVGGHRRGRRLARYPAGKAINVARTLAQLGESCVVTGFIGQGDEPWYRDFLEQQGTASGEAADSDTPLIDCRLVPVDGDTRENISVVDPRCPESDTHIVEQGFTVSGGDIERLQEALTSLAQPGVLFAFCGSLCEGVSPATFRQFLEQCIEAGAMVAVDSSGAALRAVADLPLWLIKPNREELAELTDETIDSVEQQQATAERLAGTIRWVLVSAGGEGAMLVDANGQATAHLQLDANNFKGTVGCGDVLVGSFLAGWQVADADSNRAIFALRRAVTAATLSATRDARDIDLPSVQELEEKTTVTEVS